LFQASAPSTLAQLMLDPDPRGMRGELESSGGFSLGKAGQASAAFRWRMLDPSSSPSAILPRQHWFSGVAGSPACRVPVDCFGEDLWTCWTTALASSSSLTASFSQGLYHCGLVQSTTEPNSRASVEIQVRISFAAPNGLETNEGRIGLMRGALRVERTASRDLAVPR
jgi:hypothetical protein